MKYTRAGRGRCSGHIVQLLQLGEKNRTVANHKLNAHSSRSHAVLLITVSRHGKASLGGAPTIQRGKLLLVDLAGSERQKSTQSKGQVRCAARNKTRLLYRPLYLSWVGGGGRMLSF